MLSSVEQYVLYKIESSYSQHAQFYGTPPLTTREQTIFLKSVHTSQASI